MAVSLNSNHTLDSRFNGCKREILESLREMIHNAQEHSTAAEQETESLPPISASKLQMGPWIGAGTFGAVYKAKYDGIEVVLKKVSLS